MSGKGLFHDEHGTLSMARVGFFVALVVAVIMLITDLTGKSDASAAAYGLITLLITVTALWAGGNRGLDNLASVLTSFGSGLASLLREVRSRRE